MIEGRNIVCIASNYFEHPTSKQHVMRRLSAHNSVIWVNYHASRRPTLSRRDSLAIIRRVREALAGPRPADSAIEVLSPPLIPLPESRSARFINARLVMRQVRSALSRLPARPTQLFLFAPDAPELIDAHDWEHVTYYCVDEFSAFSGYNAELINRLEHRTLLRADTVVATSHTLLEKCRRVHAQTHFLPHGVDIEHFAAARRTVGHELPADIRDIRGPILGFFGTICDYVDLELIAAAARRRSDWSFVLLGDVRCKVDALDHLTNVHLLGGKAYESLPAYCAAFDVGLIPFRMNRLTEAVNPIKLREYLAAGLPVVSSPMPSVLSYAPAVRTASSENEFVAACETALADARAGDFETRQALVQDESWRSRVEQLSQFIEQDAKLDGSPGARASHETDPDQARLAACGPIETASADVPN